MAAVNKSLWIKVRPISVPYAEPGFQLWIRNKWPGFRKYASLDPGTNGYLAAACLFCRSLSKHYTFCGNSASAYSEIGRWHHEGCHYDLIQLCDLVCFKTLCFKSSHFTEQWGVSYNNKTCKELSLTMGNFLVFYNQFSFFNIKWLQALLPDPWGSNQPMCFQSAITKL